MLRPYSPSESGHFYCRASLITLTTGIKGTARERMARFHPDRSDESLPDRPRWMAEALVLDAERIGRRDAARLPNGHPAGER